jgi:transposase-like protein
MPAVEPSQNHLNPGIRRDLLAGSRAQFVLEQIGPSAFAYIAMLLAFTASAGRMDQEILVKDISDLTGDFCTRRFERNLLERSLVIPKKGFSTEQIVALLQQIEAAMGQGKSTQIACREVGISEQSFYRWRKEYDAACRLSRRGDEGSGEGKHPSQVPDSGAVTRETS